MRSIIQVQKERKMTLNLSRGFRVAVTSFWGPQKNGGAARDRESLKGGKMESRPYVDVASRSPPFYGY